MKEKTFFRLAQPAAISLLAISVFSGTFIINSELSKLTKEIKSGFWKIEGASKSLENQIPRMPSSQYIYNKDHKPLYVVICKGNRFSPNC